MFLIPEASGYENFKIAFGFSGSDANDFASSNEWVQNFANIGDFIFSRSGVTQMECLRVLDLHFHFFRRQIFS